MGMQQMRHKGAAAAALLGLGAILTGCSRDVAGTQLASAMQGAQAPVAVSCEPNQRAVVRQVAVNGMMQSQVNCESVLPGALATSGTFGAVAPAYAPAAYQPASLTTGYAPISATEPARIVRTSYPQQVVTRRPVSYQQSERVYQPKRSVKKSVAIIGASAGVGAGVGAAVGGKKGAGIGALIGGGGAAVWDQITRRK